MRCADLFLVDVVAHGDQVLGLDQILEQTAPLGQHQVAQGDHAHQPVLLVHEIGVVRNLLVLDLLANLGHGLVGGQVLVQDDHLGVHDAARGVRVEGQEGLELRTILGGHAAEERPLQVLVQPLQKVCGVVRSHLLDDAGGQPPVQAADERLLVVTVHLGDGIGPRL